MKITVLGAGPVGSLLSVLLAGKGYKVTVYEKRPDFRRAGAEQGRSINLALSRRGLKALALAGLDRKIKDMVIPMTGRSMHNTGGELTFLPYGNEGQEIYSVSRTGLNALLLDKAEKTGVEIHFNQRCDSVELKDATVFLTSMGRRERGKVKTVTSDIIIGADGAFSALREAMRKTDRFNYCQSYISYGYKELTIPATGEGGFAMAPNALHIWPRGRYMLIALPNQDRSFTATLFLPFRGAGSFEPLNTSEAFETFFREAFPDALPLMGTLKDDFFHNPVGSMVTIQCYPWSMHGNSVLLGDAAHALVPFYGQGMNAGFEDCRVLMELLEKYGSNWPVSLKEFQKFRKPDADAISELALQNFTEMRDLVGDPQFLLRKKIEARLHQLYPYEWIPLYSMVTFSDMRYSQALALGKRQQEVMDQVMSRPDIDQHWETLDYRDIIQKMSR